MLNDIINTITFDFTCRSETAAKAMRNEIVHYKAHQITSALTEVLAAKTDPAYVWKIDKLELDLGNVHLEDIGTNYLVSTFEKLLIRYIDENKYKLHRQQGTAEARLVADDEINIIKELLLYGDLPWWVRKDTFSGADKTLEAVLDRQVDELRSFLRQQYRDPLFAKRIKTFFSTRNNTRLNSLLPGGDNKAADSESISMQQLSPASLQKIELALQQTYAAEQSALKIMTIERLLNDIPSWLLYNIKMLAALTEEELAVLEKELFGNRSKAMDLLQKLTLFQLAFLSFRPAGTDPGLPAATGHETGPLSKTVSSIAQKLEPHDPLLLYQLLLASPRQLQTLRQLFGKYKDAAAVKKTMVHLIVEHPRFREYRVLHLLTRLRWEETGPEADRIFIQLKEELEAAQAAFRELIKKLSKKESVLMREVIATGIFPSAVAKKLTVQVLNRLPEGSIRLIYGLIQLNSEEVNNLMLVDRADPPPAAYLQKTIVENAGLCLLAPYLPGFFSRLGFTEGGQFKTAVLAHRALYLLQYLVNGRQKNLEFTLQLNKLLCGIGIEEPVGKYKRLSPAERAEADDLLLSVIANWPALKSTSIQGFRSSFLQRKGILTLKGMAWVLQVERKGFDLLLDSLPWTFNLIKAPWMSKMLEVEW